MEILEKLKICQTKNEIVSVYYDPDDTAKHLTGFVGAASKTELLIYHISKHGRYDGYIIKQMDDIFRVDYAGKYERMISKLYQLRRAQHLTLDVKNILLSHSLLQFAQEKGYVLTVETEDDMISGFVERYSDEEIVMKTVDMNGAPDGITAISLNVILTLSVDTEDEQDLLLLHNHQ